MNRKKYIDADALELEYWCLNTPIRYCPPPIPKTEE